ncbi:MULTISPECIES: ABC transporter substrate-binding protein [unclassified Coleofasciculus]|uniref:ABC transporter substrate-binding protein n=1 Tax=unclassified Coleofasciculus TaxID=2692782 RepID=UPI0018817A78|nr:MULTISPECIES: ABC transporter substrate-binding protein [unclassified Coleofasciculus]MBE9129822.1 ABC transporter substrate-binding protein [Coleofasciculus sp. LEGE 07081]MBE9149141.1 ABC transporter substrate-binding protein [Coleofasciculus sp. LEGE 07092]
MSKVTLAHGTKPSLAISLAIAFATGMLTTACQSSTTTTTEDSSAGGGGDELKIATLTPSTGDLSSIGQVFPAAVELAVNQVNECGGVNGKPVSLVVEDSQTDPNAGAAGMTKLAEVDKVAGVVGAFASSVSTAALPIAVRNNVMMISPGSTSPVFTQQAQEGKYNGYWARTAPPDTYQARALAKLANEKGFKNVSTVVINNDYGVGFEKEFTQAFEKLGGTVVNKNNPTRYDPKATTFDTEAASAFGEKPDAVAAVLYAETGSLLLKAAYQQGLAEGVTVMLTDGVYSEDFPKQVGKTSDGKYLLGGAIGTVPGANGPALEEFTQLWKEKTGKEVTAYVPHSYDAAALLMLAAQAAKANTGEGIQSKIREVSSTPGTEVTDLCQAMEMVRNGEEIDYQGASSNVDIDENGDVVGDYDTWEVEPDGKLDVTGKVSPEA